MSKATRITQRLKTSAILLTGVVPLMLQPGILVGDLAASSHVKRMLDELPADRDPSDADVASLDALIRSLLTPHGTEETSGSGESMPADVWHVLVQARLISMVNGAVTLQGTSNPSQLSRSYLSSIIYGGEAGLGRIRVNLYILIGSEGMHQQMHKDKTRYFWKTIP